MIVILEDLNIFKFYKIIKYILLRKKIYYLTQSSSKYEKFVETIFFNKIIPLSWKFRELQDSSGINLYYYILHNQLEPFLNEITSNISSKNQFVNDDYFKLYISRVLSNIKLYPFSKNSILQLLFIIRSINIIFNSEKKPIILVISKIPLLSHLCNFSKNYNINIDYSNLYYLYRFLFLFLLRFRNVLGFIKRRIFYKETKLEKFKKNSNSIIIQNSFIINKPNEFMVNSSIKVENCYMINRYENVPAHIKKSALKQGYEYLDLRNFNLKKYKFLKIKFFNYSFIENFFFNNISTKFFYEKLVWKTIFTKLDCKTFLNGNFMDLNSISSASALNELNGVSIFYPISYYEFANPQTRMICDIYVTPGINTVQNINNNIDKINYVLPIGYINTYLTNFKRNNSKKIKETLIKNNVKKIIAFYDQGEVSDDMYSMGYQSSIEGYKFLLEKIIEFEWLGLIIKPKKPGLLNLKLNSIQSLLNKALSTNRLILITETSDLHVKNFENPPCQFAMAADIAIHDTMVSATAGIEAYLTNTRTVFFDHYNFKPSRFYKNKHSIVYNKWEVLWADALKFFDGSYPSFGEWDKQILNEIDNFNDYEADKRLAFITQKISENISNFDKSTLLSKVVKDYYNFYNLDYDIKTN